MTVQGAMMQFASGECSTSPSPPAPRIGAARGHLAMLDDEALFCEFVGEAADLCGYDSFVTTNPETFFDHIDRHPAAVIVLDLRMPGVDGLQALRRLAHEGVRASILLASGADGQAMDAAICLGRAQGLNMTGIIRKPIDMDALQRLLESQVQAENPLTPARLAAAIQAGELTLHYQPVVDLRAGRVIGVEALVRWEHPRLGLVMPASFVGVAEQGGLIGDLTDWALAQAVRQAAVWHKAGLTLQIAVNVSNASAPDGQLPERLERMCADAGVPPSAIALELTESAATQDPARAMEMFVRLRSKGFDLSIDDFGTGYSSLTQLQRLPFTALKIDRSFVSSVLGSEASASIVLAIISLAHALGLQCVAEGVESAETLAFLKENGCDCAQGYHIARPMPASEIAAFCKA
jgi:EAL domain-containing protein (putative c-di-GMP-specific phosphodiesterase class I)